MRNFLDLVGAGLDFFVERGGAAASLKENQFMPDLDAPGTVAGWFWRRLMRILQGGDLFHHHQLLLGRAAQVNQTEERGLGLVGAAKLGEKFGMEHAGFVGGLVLGQQFLQVCQRLHGLTFGN